MYSCQEDYDADMNARGNAEAEAEEHARWVEVENEKSFKKYINDNIKMWCKIQNLKWGIDDIIDFANFLSQDSLNVKKRNETTSNIYWLWVHDLMNIAKERAMLLKFYKK